MLAKLWVSIGSIVGGYCMALRERKGDGDRDLTAASGSSGDSTGIEHLELCVVLPIGGREIILRLSFLDFCSYVN